MTADSGYFERIDPATGHLYRYWWQVPTPGAFNGPAYVPSDWTNVGYTTED